MADLSGKILIVDDDRDHLALVGRYAASAGHNFQLAASGTEAINHINSFTFTVVITDMIMAGTDGMQLIRHIREHSPSTSVIAMTGYSNNYSYTDVIKAGASDFIVKPFPKDELIAKLRRIFREQSLLNNLRRELQYHKDVSAELLAAKNTVQQANEVKNGFINTISHEFLTPMNGILGFLELLTETTLSRKQQNFLNLIQLSADRLMGLINQLLDFSHSEDRRHRQDINFQPHAILEQTVRAITPKAEEKGLKLSFHVEHDVPTALQGDPSIIQQILNSLLENAVKFTEHGEISIRAALEQKKPPDGIILRFSVRDSGCGIPAAKQEEIFAPFSQADEYLTRRHEGAGLGLAICTRLVPMINGRIWVKSKINQGSTFHFTARLRSLNTSNPP
ncbi:MAG TPA: response regulator [Desulfobacterales bacterium]|nr:response regulator [Desulfobacterales bacterium]